MNPSDEIKSKLDIVDVLREYIQLKPAGINFRARCPFHHEKTPSFTVSPEKQIWHCFGCGKGGDIFKFIMEMEGLSFVEALRSLAPRAGVTLKKQDPKLNSQRNRLMDIMELSKKYYHKILKDGPSAEQARQYLTKRGLTEDTIDDWHIGYSPGSWDDLANALKSKGFNDNEIFLAGMSVKSDNSNRFYNRFRGRIMFPINDINGNTVAFSARVSPEKEATEKMGKYINSPQTMIYNKSAILFGMDKARQEIKKADMAIVVEGQMDVITAHQAGFKNIIASSGTALTQEQVGLIKRYTRNISLAFDMDAAGEAAAERGMQAAMGEDMHIKVIEVPNGKDPDECIKNNPAEWKKAVTGAQPMMQYFLNKILIGKNLDMIEDKRKVAGKFLPVLKILGNKMEQDFWLKKLSQAIDIKEDLLREALIGTEQKKEYNQPTAKREPAQAAKKKTREEMLSELFLALIIKFPQLIEYATDHMLPEHMADRGVGSLYNNLLIYYNNIVDNWTQTQSQTAPSLGYENFKEWLLNYSNDFKSGGEDISNTENISQLELLDKLVILSDRDFYDYNNESAKNEIIKISVILRKHHLANKMRELERLISEVESRGDVDSLAILMEEFKHLSEAIREIGK